MDPNIRSMGQKGLGLLGEPWVGLSGAKADEQLGFLGDERGPYDRAPSGRCRIS